MTPFVQDYMDFMSWFVWRSVPYDWEPQFESVTCPGCGRLLMVSFSILRQRGAGKEWVVQAKLAEINHTKHD